MVNVLFGTMSVCKIRPTVKLNANKCLRPNIRHKVRSPPQSNINQCNITGMYLWQK